MPKTLAVIVIILISFSILIGLGRQIVDALSAGDRLDSSIDEVTRLQDENRQLKQQLSQVEQYDFIEKIARNKLNMAKPGETIIVIPKEEVDRVLNPPKPYEEPKLENWQGWLKLFIH